MIASLLRLALLGMFVWFVGGPIAFGVITNWNRQECWKTYGAGNLGCKGDGTYQPPARTIN